MKRLRGKAALTVPTAMVFYLALQGLRWAANTWGVEAVALCLALPVLAIPALALWGLERKRDAEPWVEIPWEARR